MGVRAELTIDAAKDWRRFQMIDGTAVKLQWLLYCHEWPGSSRIVIGYEVDVGEAYLTSM